MKHTIKYANFEVGSGEKLQTYLPIDGTEVKIPITIINGAGDGKQIVFTSGVHSGEYPGI